MGKQSDYGKGLYRQLEDVMARLDSVEKESKVKIRTLTEEITSLKKENEELKAENQKLRDDNARMKSILNNDSSNTSTPPSKDQKGGKKGGQAANTFNGREKSGKKAGGQAGHKGKTLAKSDIEEVIRSGKAKHTVKELGDTSSGKYISKYILDLEVTPTVTEVRIYADADGSIHIPAEYRSDVAYGPNVKAITVSLYSEGVMSTERIADFLNESSGNVFRISEGSVYNFCRSFSEKAQESISHLEDDILNQAVVATDATVITVNGEQNYIRNFSIGRTVVYRALKSKAIDAMGALRLMGDFTGIFVHDHETALYHFGTDHAECNVHLIRYLRKNTEDTGNSWSGEMIKLLSEMNRARKTAISQGADAFPEETVAAYEEKYFSFLKKGRSENKKTQHKYAKEDELTLLNRMEKYSHNHLLFLHDFRVPFDDNMSERDLRKAKNRQKMAGGFRKDSGHEMYCSILTIIETLKRRKMGLIENIKKLFMGTPAIF